MQFLFRNGTEYHLVTETAHVRMGRAWVVAADYAEKHPGAWLRELVEAPKRFAFASRRLTPAEVVKWFFDTHIVGFIPAEFRAEFAPAGRVAPVPPSRRAPGELIELEDEVQATCALLELLAQQMANPDAEETGAFRGKLGDGLVTLASRQGMRLQTALKGIAR